MDDVVQPFLEDAAAPEALDVDVEEYPAPVRAEGLAQDDPVGELAALVNDT